MSNPPTPSPTPEPYYDEDGITIYHGDCREVGILRGDVMVTDPPYGIGWRRNRNRVRWSLPHEGIANDQDTSARDCVLTAWGNAPAVVFGSFYAPFPADVRQVLVWWKIDGSGVVGSTTGFRRDAEPVFLLGDWPQRNASHSSVLKSCVPNIAHPVMRTGHPHTKPVDLMADLIRMTPEGVVVDPFMGSGSTLVAARQLNRRAIGIEIEERYCEIAVKRLAQGVLL